MPYTQIALPGQNSANNAMISLTVSQPDCLLVYGLKKGSYLNSKGQEILGITPAEVKAGYLIQCNDDDLLCIYRMSSKRSNPKKKYPQKIHREVIAAYLIQKSAKTFQVVDLQNLNYSSAPNTQREVDIPLKSSASLSTLVRTIMKNLTADAASRSQAIMRNKSHQKSATFVHQRKCFIGIAIGFSLAILAVCGVLTAMLPIIPLELVWGVGVAAIAVFCFAAFGVYKCIEAKEKQSNISDTSASAFRIFGKKPADIQKKLLVHAKTIDSTVTYDQQNYGPRQSSGLGSLAGATQN